MDGENHWKMFLRPRFSRIWILLAGGVLLILFGWVIRRKSSIIDFSVDDVEAENILDPGEISLDFKNHQIFQRDIFNFSKLKLLQPNQSVAHNFQPKPVLLQHGQSEIHQSINQADTPGQFQIHFKPLKYTTTELYSKLNSLKLDDTEMTSRIQEQLNICSNFESKSDNSSKFYKDLISSSLSAWYDFIPPHQDMISSHCWYTDTFKRVSPSLESRLSKWNSLYHIADQFSKKEMKKIFSTVMGQKQRAVFHNSSSPTNQHSNFFCVPKFYLGGFPKCGTTALYSYLTAHHSIVEPATKEGQFWREFVVAEENDYRRFEVMLYLYHFKHAANKIKFDTDKRLTLDGSASTIFASAQQQIDVEKDMCVVPLLLSKVLPSTKLIFIMRDPVQRLWSDYWYFCSKDHFNSDEVPQELLKRSSEMFHNHSIAVVESFIDCTHGRSEFECVLLAHSNTGENSACKSARVGLSLYYFHVIRWLSVFPRKQLLFLTLEDLKRNTYSVLERVWKFLGLSPLPQNQLPKHVTTNSNEWIKSEKYRDKFKMWPETNRILQSFFHPYNTRLAELLKDNQFLWEN